MKIDKATKVCISISEFPGTSGATIHNSLCKVDGLGALASKAGGGCLEMVGNDHVYPTFEELLSVILGGGISNNSQFDLSSWEECMNNCFGVIEDVCGK